MSCLFSKRNKLDTLVQIFRNFQFYYYFYDYLSNHMWLSMGNKRKNQFVYALKTVVVEGQILKEFHAQNILFEYNTFWILQRLQHNCFILKQKLKKTLYIILKYDWKYFTKTVATTILEINVIIRNCASLHNIIGNF